MTRPNALCTEIAEEGIVLLQNDDNELPLASGSNLNVFGWASVGPVYGGTGAGAISADRPTVSLLDGLHNAGINTNTELSDFYTAYCAERRRWVTATITGPCPNPPPPATPKS